MAIGQEILKVLRGVAEQGLLNGDRLRITANVYGDEAVAAERAVRKVRGYFYDNKMCCTYE